MKVKDICSCETLTVTAQDTVKEAACKMAKHNIGALPVVDYSLRVIGMITDRDITVRITAEGKDASRYSVGDIMTHDISCVCMDADIESATKIMSKAKVRRLPVVDDGRIVGFISLGDITRTGKFDMEAGHALCEISSNRKTCRKH
ncbi:MAG: CBS domain-containing protein [Clostridia bacterium]|nr:CBS domain-containing protein [Clostridia bacterium]